MQVAIELIITEYLICTKRRDVATPTRMMLKPTGSEHELN